MKRLLWLAIASVLLSLGSGATAQEVRLRLASFVPPNTSFGIPAKRWVDEVSCTPEPLWPPTSILLFPESVAATATPMQGM